MGSFNTSDEYPLWAGGTAGYGGKFPYGELTSYSSYSTFPDRPSLPSVCAPGAALVSSYNADYINTLSTEEKALSISASVVHGGKTYYWGPSHGTSMATPLVAGAIATWLEANPHLTPTEIKEIIAKTSVKDSQVKEADAARWGAGKLDAYAGIKEAVRLAAGISDVAQDSDSPLMVSASGRSYSFFLGGAEAIDAEIWSLDGRRIATGRTAGDEITIDLQSATPGVYIARINGTHSKRIIVK